MPISLSDIAILNIKGADNCCINCGISKCEAINVMQNIDLTKKSINHKNLLPHIKMGEETLTVGDIEIEKNRFFCHKIFICLQDADTEKVLVSNKISSAEKSYLCNNLKVKP